MNQNVIADSGHSVQNSQAKFSSAYRGKLEGLGIWAGRRDGSLAGTSVGVNMTCH